MRLRIFHARMALAERLFDLAAWVQPEYRSRHRVSEDGQTVTIWDEPA